ncbi:MAG: NAD(P)H-binding protein [Flavobacteriales bacterium]|jgi:dTDP-4-dehydrorhamnose reductase|tara:strand:- start:724 stop:1383 length:660 start_codon:yes stop_codon:yes gene_type:complete
MKKNIAVLFGGTGLTGSHLLDMLVNDSSFESVIVVSRKKIIITHEKISNKIIDFSNYKEIESCIAQESIVFSCIGTTQADVKGDKQKYKEIDFDISLNIANACKKLRANKFLFISSGGANSSSSNFYLKLKGEIEDSVIKTNNNTLFIFKPSLLIGKRKKERFLESIGQTLMPLFSYLLPTSIKAVKASCVANAMINLSKSSSTGVTIIENKEILNYCS